MWEAERLPELPELWCELVRDEPRVLEELLLVSILSDLASITASVVTRLGLVLAPLLEGLTAGLFSASCSGVAAGWGSPSRGPRGFLTDENISSEMQTNKARS